MHVHTCLGSRSLDKIEIQHSAANMLSLALARQLSRFPRWTLDSSTSSGSGSKTLGSPPSLGPVSGAFPLFDPLPDLLEAERFTELCDSGGSLKGSRSSPVCTDRSRVLRSRRSFGTSRSDIRPSSLRALLGAPLWPREDGGRRFVGREIFPTMTVILETTAALRQGRA